VLFTLVLVFLLFDVGFGDPNASRRRTSMSASHGPAIMMPSRQPSTTHHIEVFTTGNSCKDSGCDFFNMAECGQAFITVAGGSVCSQTQCYGRGFPKTPGVQKDAEWGANYPPQCFMIMQAIGTGPANWASMYNNNGAWGGAVGYRQQCTADAQCICKCPNPTPAPTPAPTETVCKKLKGEIKDKCGGDSPVNKVIQNAQDAVDTSPQDPMVDLGEYKLSDLEKEQKEGTCSFAKSDPAYLATELILKINKLSTLV